MKSLLRRQNIQFLAGLILLALGLYCDATGHVLLGLIWVALGLSFLLLAQIQTIPLDQRPRSYGQMARHPKYTAAMALGLAAFVLIIINIVKNAID